MSIRLPRLRHLRYSVKNLLTTKRRRLAVWAAAVSAALDSTGTGQVVTVAVTDIATVTTHGHATGDGPFVLTNAGGALPAGLAVGTLYWLNKIDADTFKLHTSRNEALEGSAPVDVTGTGSGTHTITPATTSQAVIERLRQGNTAYQLQAEDDIDDIT